MRIFYDCEFLEDGKTIDLISIGLIAEAGDEYYAVNSDMPIERIESHGWLMKKVDDVRRARADRTTCPRFDSDRGQAWWMRAWIIWRGACSAPG